MRKGEINILTLISAGVAIAIASISGFFYQNNRIGAVETRASVLEVRYEDIDKKLDRIENKLDGVLSSGIKSNIRKEVSGFSSSSINGRK